MRPKGVQKYSTPSDTTPSRSASTALGLERCFSGSRQAFVARGVPPIHFGREDGVERTLLRVACQSETFLAPPWQGSVDIRVLWHIGCQSDFDELVSMSSRPVDRGSGRMGSISTTFHPVKSRFGRMKTANRKSSSASEPPHRARRSA